MAKTIPVQIPPCGFLTQKDFYCELDVEAPAILTLEVKSDHLPLGTHLGPIIKWGARKIREELGDPALEWEQSDWGEYRLEFNMILRDYIRAWCQKYQIPFKAQGYVELMYSC